MKLVDEKKALQEVSNLKRSRRQLESSGSADDAITSTKAKLDELRQLLDDPESRKVSDKFDELKREMDGLKEEGNKAYEERGKLFDERNALSAQLVSGHQGTMAVHDFAYRRDRMSCMARSASQLNNIAKTMTSE